MRRVFFQLREGFVDDPHHSLGALNRKDDRRPDCIPPEADAVFSTDQVGLRPFANEPDHSRRSMPHAILTGIDAGIATSAECTTAEE